VVDVAMDGCHLITHKKCENWYKRYQLPTYLTLLKILHCKATRGKLVSWFGFFCIIFYILILSLSYHLFLFFKGVPVVMVVWWRWHGFLLNYHKRCQFISCNVKVKREMGFLCINAHLLNLLLRLRQEGLYFVLKLIDVCVFLLNVKIESKCTRKNLNITTCDQSSYVFIYAYVSGWTM